MSDWEVGDLAVCVDTAPRLDWVRWTGDPEYTRELRAGGVYKVLGVKIDPANGKTSLDIGVRSPNPRLSGKFWPARRFRKIRPDKHEACEEEFVTLLKRKKVSA